MLINIHLHFGGGLVREGADYEGEIGVQVYHDQDLDTISLFDFVSYIGKCGYGAEFVEFWYAEPGKSLLEGRSQIRTDADIIRLQNRIIECRCSDLHVYVVHLMPDGVEDLEVPLNVIEPDFVHVAETESELSVNDESSGDDELNMDDKSQTNGLLNLDSPNLDNLEDDVLDDDPEYRNDSDLDTDDGWDSEDERDKNRHGDRYRDGDSFKLFQRFKDAADFRDAVKTYSVKNHRPVKFERSNYDRVAVRCVDKSYPYRIWCSLEKRLCNFQIKKIDDHHTCSMSSKNRLCDSVWLSKTFMEKFRANNCYRARDLRTDCLQEFGLNVSQSQCYRARHAAFRKIQGTQSEHFAKLRCYEKELKKTNRGSTIEIVIDNSNPEKPLFRRMYVGFEALRKCWIGSCRPIIGLDGDFLKWFVKGELLSAVGRDANNQMFPIAWAVVEVENIETWSWFLKILSSDLELSTGDGLTIVSDGQKGLLTAIKDLLPNVNHRLCARHVYANWRKKWKQTELKPLFWGVSKAYTIEEMDRKIDEVKNISVDAALDIRRTNMEAWCRAYFRDGPSCDVIHNNMSESFNSSIRSARAKPIIGMLEDIRTSTMHRMAKRIEKISKWKGRITPKIQEQIERNMLKSVYAQVITNGRQKWEVHFEDDACVVDMVHRTCSCRVWSLSGIPCYHATAVILRNNAEVADYVSPFYTREYWIKTYEHVLCPVNGERMWERSTEPNIHPPKSRKMLGRPKRKRIKDPFESPTRKGKGTRDGRIVTCTHCLQTGHNRSGCAKRKSGEPAAPKPSKRRPGRPSTSSQGSSSGVPGRPPRKRRSVLQPAAWNQLQMTDGGLNEDQHNTQPSPNATI